MRTELGLAIGFIIASFFKWMHWPFAGILTVSVLGALSVMYILGGFVFFKNNNENMQTKIFSIISGLVLSAVPLGLLFKFQHWPGASVLLLIAIIGAPILLCASILMRRNAVNSASNFYNKMVIRCSALTLALCLLALIYMG
ncbi:MAG: hypothetical protein AAF193_04345 [Bacteroidota bacterium]